MWNAKALRRMDELPRPEDLQLGLLSLCCQVTVIALLVIGVVTGSL